LVDTKGVISMDGLEMVDENGVLAVWSNKAWKETSSMFWVVILGLDGVL